MTDDRETLYDKGNVYVTRRAAQEYAQAVGLDARDDLETARLQLTSLLLDAHETSGGSWRRRSAAAGVDVSAMVRFAEDLAIVTHVSVHVRAQRAEATRSGEAKVTKRKPSKAAQIRALAADGVDAAEIQRRTRSTRQAVARALAYAPSGVRPKPAPIRPRRVHRPLQGCRWW